MAEPHDRPPARLALFLSDLGMGGAERNIVTLAGAFAKRGHAVDIVLVRKKGPLLSDIPTGVGLVELGTASRPAALAGLWRNADYSLGQVLSLVPGKLPVVVRGAPSFVGYLRQRRPDAVLTSLVKNNIAAVWAAAAAGTGTRTVIREATHLSDELAGKSAGFDGTLMAAVRRWYPRADAVVAVSGGVADDLAQFVGMPRARIATIHNPVDLERVDRLAGEDPGHPWFGDGGPPVLLAAGRLAPEKDHATLLRSFAALRRTRPLRLVILGDGPERDALTALARSLDMDTAIDLPGRVDNPYAYLKRAQAFVSSSTWEGFPNAILEALACGCPVAATDCPGGLREIVDDGAFAALAPVGDAEALAGAIARTLDAPPAAQRLRARAGLFALDAAAERYLDLMIGPAAAGQARAQALAGSY